MLRVRRCCSQAGVSGQVLLFGPGLNSLLSLRGGSVKVFENTAFIFLELQIIETAWVAGKFPGINRKGHLDPAAFFFSGSYFYWRVFRYFRLPWNGKGPPGRRARCKRYS
jgi:hypothetical protein